MRHAASNVIEDKKMNPYRVIQKPFPNAQAIADELNKQRNEGFDVIQIWDGPGSNTSIALLHKPQGGQQNFGN
jgi:hypothetical protein